MAHPDGENAVARVASQMQIPLILSSNSNASIEEVGKNNPDQPKFFQIYMSIVEDINLDLWKRAKDSGFTGFVFTCDTQLLGKRENDIRNSFNLPKHLKMGNFSKYMPEKQAT